MKRKLFLFTIVGVIQYAVDASAFALLILLSNPLVVANPVSRVFSAIVGYTLNHQWTFIKREKDLGDLIKAKPIMRYVCYWAVMTTLSTYAIYLINETMSQTSFVSLITAKLVVEVVLFILSFMLSLLWVYRH